MQIYALIMAGGQGTRFWPLSRRHMPKQFVNISGNDIMLNETIKRLLGVIPIENILVITNRKQSHVVNQLILSDLPRENLLFEPVERGTSACVAYASMVISSRCENAVMCVFPSDHYITELGKYVDTVTKACTVAHETGKLITIGIRPTFPATGYGYIRFKKGKFQYSDVYEVEEFIEKPAIDAARKYLKENCFLWNSGMFIWKVSTILDNLKRYLPRLFKKMSKIREFIGTEKEEGVVDSVYSNLQNLSIDYAILERSDDVLVIPGDFGWNDVGSWDTLGTIFPTDENGNIVKAKHLGINTKNSIIYGDDRLIATIGLEEFIIADTSDALLICPKGKAQEVKNIVELIKDRQMNEYI